jgi:hypothetical protein
MQVTTEQFFLDIKEEKLLTAFKLTTSCDRVKIIEETIKLYVNDKPKYFPQFLW